MGHGPRGLQRGGDSWNYFTHDQARSRAYRWGEDGLAGISDDQQRLCFALALWNGKDPILKERLFGLTNSESNHGEDVKEYYFYLDSTPTHSYMKFLYKYPQGAYPYSDLVETSRRRGRNESEYELLDTGVFDGDRYWDVFVEYAKNTPEDVLILISAHNRGPEPAELHVLPTLWFRNLWSWHDPADRPVMQDPRSGGSRRPGHRRRDRRAVPRLRGGRPLALHGERDEHAADLRRPEPDPVRQGQHQRLRRARPGGPPEPGADRDQGRRPLPPDGRPRRVPDDPVAPLRRRPDGRGPGQRVRCGALRRPLRRGLPGAAGRGGRVLRRRHPALAGRRRGQRDAAGPGGDALVQAVLPLRRRQVAGGARVRPVQADAEGRPAQRPLAPHVQRRRHLHARQVGVPLVRGLGPRLPRPRPDARRPGLRQASAQADAARAVHAPQRPDPGLRVELRRRQPAGPRLVDHLHLPPRSGGSEARGTGSGSRAASRSCC